MRLVYFICKKQHQVPSKLWIMFFDISLLLARLCAKYLKHKAAFFPPSKPSNPGSKCESGDTVCAATCLFVIYVSLYDFWTSAEHFHVQLTCCHHAQPSKWNGPCINKKAANMEACTRAQMHQILRITFRTASELVLWAPKIQSWLMVSFI